MDDLNSNLQIDTKPDPPDLTPLIDVIFILLVFFLLTSTIQDRILEIDLAGSAESEEETVNRELVIEINRDNLYYIDGIQSDFKAVSEAVKREASLKNSPVITVRSDRGADFGSVVKILDLAKKYSIRGINFSVEKEE